MLKFAKNGKNVVKWSIKHILEDRIDAQLTVCLGNPQFSP